MSNQTPTGNTAAPPQRSPAPPSSQSTSMPSAPSSGSQQLQSSTPSAAVQNPASAFPNSEAHKMQSNTVPSNTQTRNMQSNDIANLRRPLQLKPTGQGEVYDLGTFPDIRDGSQRHTGRDQSLYASTGALSTSSFSQRNGDPGMSLYSSQGSAPGGGAGRSFQPPSAMATFDAAMHSLRKEHLTTRADLEASRDQVMQLQDAMSRMNADLLNMAPLQRENKGLKQERDIWLQRQNQATMQKQEAEQAAMQWRQRHDEMQRQMEPLKTENEMVKKERENMLARLRQIEKERADMQRELSQFHQTAEESKLKAKQLQDELDLLRSQPASRSPAPLPPQPKPAPNIVGVGMILGHTEGEPGFRVSQLVPGGAAEESRQVQVGDSLIKISDQNVQSWNLDAITTSVKGPEGSVVLLDFVTRSGHIKRVSLTRRKTTPMAPPTPSSLPARVSPQLAPQHAPQFPPQLAPAGVPGYRHGVL